MLHSVCSTILLLGLIWSPTETEAKPLSRTRRQTALACEDLIATHGANSFRVAIDHGVTNTCAAAKLRGAFECHISTIAHGDAHATCASIGARLCTFAEIDAHATRGLGCDGLYDEGSYCWTSDSASECADGEAMATRCRHFGGDQKDDPTLGVAFCRTKSELGSLACCATGGPDLVDLVSTSQGREFANADCSPYDCAYDCAHVPGCGWSSHQVCEAGQKNR